AAMSWLMHAASLGLAVLVVRQARKSGGEIHNAGRGSGAFGGAADILLHLDYERDEKGHPKEDSTIRFLRLKSRLEREQLPPMRLDYEHGVYRLLDQHQVVSAGERMAELRRRVLVAIGGQRLSVEGMGGIREKVPARKSDLLKALEE